MYRFRPQNIGTRAVVMPGYPSAMLVGAGQFHFFPLCNVAAGGSALVSTVATGGLGAGVTFVEKHLGILPIRLDRAECLHRVANFNIPV